MQVYRVEDEDGGGPYNGENAPTAFTGDWIKLINGNINKDGNDLVNQPSPYRDIPEWAEPFTGHKRYRFGFRTIEQLHSWFHDGARQELDRRGFKWAKYEVPDQWVHVGGHQVAFDARRAKLIERLPLSAAGQGELFTSPSTLQKPSTDVDIQF